MVFSSRDNPLSCHVPDESREPGHGDGIWPPAYFRVMGSVPFRHAPSQDSDPVSLPMGVGSLSPPAANCRVIVSVVPESVPVKVPLLLRWFSGQSPIANEPV